LSERTRRLPFMIILMFSLAFLIRLYSCQNTLIINPDGAKYICQARAVYYGQWKETTSCRVSGVSSYPFLIAGAYTIFRDWVASARIVSLLFGFAALIPLYLLLRSFFEYEIGLLATLVVGLTPVLVRGSADVIRDPICWFFLALGLYFFVAQMGKRRDVYLVLSCLSWLLAAWAMTEAVFVIPGSFFYLLAFEQNHRLRKAFVFVLPLLTGAFLLLAVQMVYGLPLIDAFRIPKILLGISTPFHTYHLLQTILTDIIQQNPYDILRSFLPEVKNSIWLISLGTLLNRSLEAFFYPFFLIVVVGVWGVGGSDQERPASFLFLPAGRFIGLSDVFSHNADLGAHLPAYGHAHYILRNFHGIGPGKHHRHFSKKTKA
jgi:4-amino-4-deoxy-L-arabinose transferase-like glycosyltransferase